MNPAPPISFGPHIPIVDMVYTAIIVFACLLIFFMTREAYSLSRYKGLSYFRNTFLFFGLSYIAALIPHLLMLGSMTMDILSWGRHVMPLSLVLMGYLSTMAIMYLTYSLVWKNIPYKYFIIFAHGSAVILSVAAFLTRSHLLIFFIQAILFVIAAMFALTKHDEPKKHSNMIVLYGLLFIFWLLNIYTLGPRPMIPPELIIFLQAASIGVFVIIYHKISKWSR